MLEALMDLLPDEAEDVRRLIEAAISFGLDGEEVDDVPRSVRAHGGFSRTTFSGTTNAIRGFASRTEGTAQREEDHGKTGKPRRF